MEMEKFEAPSYIHSLQAQAGVRGREDESEGLTGASAEAASMPIASASCPSFPRSPGSGHYRVRFIMGRCAPRLYIIQDYEL